MSPTPNTPAFRPAYRLNLTRLLNPETGHGFWYANIKETGISAQGPSVLWCLGRLSRHIPSLKSETTLHGSN